MSNVPSNEAPRCPECGATLEGGASECWLCRRTHEAENPYLSSSSKGDHKKGVGQFSLASIFLVITLIAVCLGALLHPHTPAPGSLPCLIAGPWLTGSCVHSSRVISPRRTRPSPPLYDLVPPPSAVDLSCLPSP